MKRSPVRSAPSPVAAMVTACIALSAGEALAQSTAATSSTTPAPRPWGRVSFFTTAAQTDVDGAPSRNFGEFASSITFQLPDQEGDGVDYGVDLRHSAYSTGDRPQRASIYEGFVGARVAGGAVRARLGHLWLNDLGALGSVAGAAVEYRQPATRASSLGRVRIGGFGGLEPRTFDIGYADNVKKAGAYVALDGEGARRNVLGFVTIRDGAVTERSVLTMTNYVPVGARLSVYQAAEYDVVAPAGEGRAGLTYLFVNGRVAPSRRVDLQGTYSRGRSVDTRGLADDVLNGRPLSQTAVEGLLYESAGGRVTVEVVPRVRVYGGYSRDTTNRDGAPTGRATIGGFAGNLMGSGLDLTASDSITDASNRSLHAQYVSLGRQIGRSLYVSGDYSTSLSLLRFSRSDGLLVELQPHTRRLSGTATMNLPASTSLMLTIDRTTDGSSADLRLMAGVTYRFR
jgi:hypothetical protein